MKICMIFRTFLERGSRNIDHSEKCFKQKAVEKNETRFMFIMIFFTSIIIF